MKQKYRKLHSFPVFIEYFDYYNADKSMEASITNRNLKMGSWLVVLNDMPETRAISGRSNFEGTKHNPGNIVKEAL